MSDAVLSVNGLSRAFGRVRAVDRLSFDIAPGSVYGFIGPNGAGKTTTMRMLATLDLPDAGDATIGGHSVTEQPRKVRRLIGFMADHFTAYPNVSVREFLDFFARAYGLRGRERSTAIDAIVDFCGLDTFVTRPATGLSKGMGQRLHLAKTLLHDPLLLILDEPTAGLDPRARIEFRELIRELAARGKSVLVSSHILAELGEMCDGAIVIEQGRQVASGGIAELAKGLAGTTRIEVRVVRDADAAARFFLVQPLVSECSGSDDRITFQFDGDDERLAELLARAIAAGLGLVEFRTVKADLEDIFLASTKGKLQ